MIELFNRILFAISRWSAWLGMGFLFGAMFVTAADVVMRKLNGEGIFGAVDIVQLMVMGAAYLSIPYGFLSRGHVAVSLVVDRFNRRAAALTNLLAATLGTGFMAAVAWFGFEQAQMQMEYGDVSLTLGIPKIYYWIPLLAGSALSALVSLHMAVEAGYTVATGRGGLAGKTPAQG